MGLSKSSLVHLAAKKNWSKCHAMLDLGKGNVHEGYIVRPIHTSRFDTLPGQRLPASSALVLVPHSASSLTLHPHRIIENSLVDPILAKMTPLTPQPAILRPPSAGSSASAEGLDDPPLCCGCRAARPHRQAP